MEDGSARDLIRREVAEATNLGVSGTPTIFVNGSLISGGADYQRLAAAVTEALPSSTAPALK